MFRNKKTPLATRYVGDCLGKFLIPKKKTIFQQVVPCWEKQFEFFIFKVVLNVTKQFSTKKKFGEKFEKVGKSCFGIKNSLSDPLGRGSLREFLIQRGSRGIFPKPQVTTLGLTGFFGIKTL